LTGPGQDIKQLPGFVSIFLQYFHKD
jgi:hypothetical protein